MIRFVFGRPGTGKTYTTVERIRSLICAEERRVYLIVPEQMAYSAERDILSSLPPDAGKTFSIISFSRLCDLLSDRFGGRSRHTLSRAMRTLFMWQNLRELTGLPEIYRISTTDDTLCRKMLAAVEELTVNAVSPAQLEGAASRLPAGAPLRGKLRDLSLIGAAYNGLVTEVLGENPADRLLRAAEQIEANDFFANAAVFIDAFTSFTAQEYAVLRPIIRQAHEVTVTLGCGGRYNREPQFESLSDTTRRLTRLCEDAGQDYEDIVLDTDRRTLPAELSLLEKQLWNYTFSAETDALPPESERGHVHLTVTPTLYDEAEAAALHILALHDAGIPYGEIALVVRDTATWSGVLNAALEQYGIPYFLSDRTDLNEKPAARLLLTALRAVARHWQADDLVALCKTGLCGVTPRETDYFAEYTDTWHLAGKRMTDVAWSMNPDGYTVELTARGKVILEAANRVRKTLMTPLLSLERDIRVAESVTDQCRALFRYLRDLSVKDQLVGAAEEHLRLGQVREAGELTRLWTFLTETLATVASVMESAEPMSAEELGCALSLVFGETDIGSVPMRHDCVTVGSASTLRVDHIRAMLILGLCEGEFPPSLVDDGLFSEQDKETLSDLGIELDSRESRRMSEELMYIWRAVSKPTEYLHLSHSTSTPDGQVRTPSVAVGRVTDILPYLSPDRFASSMMQTGESVRHRAPMTDTVSKPVIRHLLGEETWLSQSKLSTYARCPYSYYGAYLLRLRERTEAKLDNLGAGLFLHHVMEQYLRRTLDEDNRICPMKADEIKALADAIIEAYIREVAGEAATNGRLLHLFDRLRQVALVLIDSIQAELSSSDFSVAGLEWDTHGYHPGAPRPMSLTLGSDGPMSFAESFMAANYPEGRTPSAEAGEHGLPTNRPVQNLTPEGIMGLPIHTPPEDSPIRLLLGGRVDRVDLYRAADGETVYVRVVDYKSSKHDFSLRSVSESMNIQLLLYLFTLCSPENRALFADKDGRIPARVLPAGAVYMSPDESDKNGVIRALRTGVTVIEPEVIGAVSHDPETVYLPSVRRDKTGNLTGKGLISPTEMTDLQGILVGVIRDTAATMYEGCATRTPSADACRYCRVRQACAARVD